MTTRIPGRHRRPSATTLRSQHVLASAMVGSVVLLGPLTGSASASPRDGGVPAAHQGGSQGAAASDPDQMENGGADKPGGTGGTPGDQDGNNGSGNDEDCEDDNNGVDPLPSCDRRAEARSKGERPAPARPHRGAPARTAGDHNPGGALEGGTPAGSSPHDRAQESTVTTHAAASAGTHAAASAATHAAASVTRDAAASVTTDSGRSASVLGTKIGRTRVGGVGPSGAVAATGVESASGVMGASRAPASGLLAATGAEVAPMAGAGLAAVALGALAYAAGRRRSESVQDG